MKDGTECVRKWSELILTAVLLSRVVFNNWSRLVSKIRDKDGKPATLSQDVGRGIEVNYKHTHTHSLAFTNKVRINQGGVAERHSLLSGCVFAFANQKQKLNQNPHFTCRTRKFQQRNSTDYKTHPNLHWLSNIFLSSLMSKIIEPTNVLSVAK